MSKMFIFNSRRMVTWNLFTGCRFNCSYCWARKLAETRLKRSYPNGFIPTTHPDRFNKRFKPDDFVFVSSMGDITYAPSSVMNVVIATAQKCPETKFLLCTKDPSIYWQVKFHQPNLYVGTTIETNRDTKAFSRAPTTRERYSIFRDLNHGHKFLSLEPLMDFDLIPFVKWITSIKPEIIEVGADNYHNNLPEPGSEKVNRLLAYLKQMCPTVIEKDGLGRLKKEE